MLGVVEISNLTKIKHPNVSTSLKILEKENLVICLTKNKRTWKKYELTNLGKKILKEIKKQ
jgi:DNA-binding PadR family transcriptional regulator